MLVSTLYFHVGQTRRSWFSYWKVSSVSTCGTVKTAMDNEGCKNCNDLDSAASSKCFKHYLHYAKPLNYFERNELHTAAHKGHNGMIPLLCQPRLNIDINGRTRFKQTPLMHSINFNHFGCSHTLLEYGAETSLKDYRGKTAIDYAFENEKVGKGNVLFIFMYYLCTSYKMFNMIV